MKTILNPAVWTIISAPALHDSLKEFCLSIKAKMY